MSLSIIFEAVVFFLCGGVLNSTSSNFTRQQKLNNLFESRNSKSYNKCGFHVIANYLAGDGDKFSVKGVLQVRPTNDTSIVSPSGKFRIHFDTTDAAGNQPFLYDASGQLMQGSTLAFVDSVARICDHVYHVEVDSLGFPPPPSDSGAGGGNEYDIYIEFLSPGVYGYTDFNLPLINRVNSTYAAWTVIRNEFESTYTKGIPAIEVTIAHEFHHGIQVGNYGLWGDDLWFYELTSTWMEQVVYPEVKDYYQYLGNFFDNVDLPLNLYQTYDFAGYERCVFGIFLQNEYAPLGAANVMKGIWENMAREAVIPAIEGEFRSIGVDPSYAFQLFTQWNYFTGYRSQLALLQNVVTYPLADEYPLAKLSGFDTLRSGGVFFANMPAQRLTEHFFRIYAGIDTIGIIVANNNFPAAAVYDTTQYFYSVGISPGGPACVRELTNGYCISFSAADRSDWGIVPSISRNDSSIAVALRDNIVFPQPFNPSNQQNLRIPYPFSDESHASLSIMGISGNLINVINGGSEIVQDLNGKVLSVGWAG